MRRMRGRPHPSTHDIQEHPALVRVAHWLQALAIILMIGSGWRIYNSVPIFGSYRFPIWATLGGDPMRSKIAHMDPGVANALNWHFTGMWLLLGSYVLFMAHGAVSGHFFRHLLPLRPRDIYKDFVAAATFRLSHRLGEYNAVQRAAYWGVLFAILMMFLTGLAIWKPVQLSGLTWLLGGYPTARVLHFLFMSAICLFMIVHVALVVLVPKTFVAMVFGRAAMPMLPPHRSRRPMPVNETKFSVAVGPVIGRNKFIADVDRRKFLRSGMSLGALTLLTGCDISDNDTVQQMFARVSRWNNFVQEELFRGAKLAPEYPESMAVKDFRYNAWYQAPLAPVINAAEYRLELAGLIADKRPWTIDQLYTLPQKSQVTRHVCVEGWSMIGKWTGTPLKTFLNMVGADITAKYVGFVCADGYYESIDMPTALHPQTIMAFKLSDTILPSKYGFPFKIRIPTKLGFKQPKFVTAIYVTNRNPGGFWVDRGYNWFSGI